MKQIGLALAIVWLSNVALQAEPEIKGTAEELIKYLRDAPRFVFLSGESEIKVASDLVQLSIAVVTENRSLQEASRQNQAVRGNLINSLQSRGISSDRIQAAKFSSTPKYGIFGEKAKSYRVENVVKITVQDEKEFQVVAQLVDANAEVRYGGIEFNHSDKDGLKQRALREALERAAEKKRVYEEELNVKLTVRGFVEQRVQDPSLMPMRAMRSSADEKMTFGSLSDSARAPNFAASEWPTSFAELVYRAYVTVEYTVEPR